jgi:hypothetical protein
MKKTGDQLRDDVLAALDAVRKFKGSRLSTTIGQLERSAEARKGDDLRKFLAEKAIDGPLLRSAVAVKRAAAQIDEVVHAVGTLLALPEILDEDEVIESLSLAAGNTGRDYDVETNKRVAEFTFIEWKGGPEAIRKQKLFKDFYVLAEAKTEKKRFIYIVGDEFGPKVFLSRSLCTGMLRKFAFLQKEFAQQYGSTLPVREYYDMKKHLVEIVDLRKVAPVAAKMLE